MYFVHNYKSNFIYVILHVSMFTISICGQRLLLCHYQIRLNDNIIIEETDVSSPHLSRVVTEITIR